MDGPVDLSWGDKDWIISVPEVPVGEQFAPAAGDSLLQGKLRKESGPVLQPSPSTSLTSSSDLVLLTNGDFLSLLWSARQLVEVGAIQCKYYDIVCRWIVDAATVGKRTPHAVLAKGQRVECKYKAALIKYNRRPTSANHQHLYAFLSSPLLWKEESASCAVDVKDAEISEQLPVVPLGLVSITSSLPSTVPSTLPAPLPSNLAASLPSNLAAPLPSTLPQTLPSTLPQTLPTTLPSTATIGTLRDGKTLLSPDAVKCFSEQQKLSTKLNRVSAQAAKFKEHATKLSAAVTVGMTGLMKENATLKKDNEKLFESKAAVLLRYKELRKTSIPRALHGMVLDEVTISNQELKQAVQSLTLQLESKDVDLERAESKLAIMQKKNNRLRMDSTRKGVALETSRVAAAAALEKLRMDKDASDSYSKEVHSLLQQQVEAGKLSNAELEKELLEMKKLETKDSGVYSTRVRLLYYDLLAKGVSTNTVQSVVKSVLTHATSINAESLSLPSRSTAQRMVLEAGELVKVRASYELVKNKGELGHHSDGTTKSLIHWGMHVLKLDCEDGHKTFNLTVSPVASGKAVDTVNHLKEQMFELEQIARDMGLDPGNAFHLERIITRMSDRANNERAVTKLLREQKETALASDPAWDQLSAEEKAGKLQMYEFTCASHKIDNVANAMTTASAESLYPNKDAAAGQRKGLVGAKKLIYEVNKLICQQSRKEYSRGRDFKMFCLDREDATYKGTAAHLLQPVVGNRYIVFLLNAIPTIMSKEILMVFLEGLKDSKEGAATLNRLELSVWQGFLNRDIEAELCAFCLMFFFVCQPLLSRAKAAKSPLAMNFYYTTAVRRLAAFEEDSAPLLAEDPELWADAVKETEPFRPYIPQIQLLASRDSCKDKVCTILCKMAAAGRMKLVAHAAEHLPGGIYHLPSPGAVAAGCLLGSATNDIVESGFGLLDRQQTMCPTRNPVNTSAIVTAKRDKPVTYVQQHDAETRDAMVATARKSAHRKRTKEGTTDQQLLKLWQAGSEERDTRIRRRRENRQKKDVKRKELVVMLQSGQLTLSAATVNSLKSKDLLLQLQMWGHLKTLGLVKDSVLLKGSSALKVAEKKERLKALIEGNPDVAGSLPLARFDAPLPPAVTGDSIATPADESETDHPPDDAQSSSDEEVQDTETFTTSHGAGLHPFSFTKTGERVVVAFAGGVWYPGVVDAVVTRESAVINYLHPSTLTVPLPDSATFGYPNKKDKMETDAANVFLHDFLFEQTNTNSRTFTLSHPISLINTKYKHFAALHNIPQ